MKWVIVSLLVGLLGCSPKKACEDNHSGELYAHQGGGFYQDVQDFDGDHGDL